jgi:hypothetical protein
MTHARIVNRDGVESIVVVPEKLMGNRYESFYHNGNAAYVERIHRVYGDVTIMTLIKGNKEFRLTIKGER